MSEKSMQAMMQELARMQQELAAALQQAKVPASNGKRKREATPTCTLAASGLEIRRDGDRKGRTSGQGIEIEFVNGKPTDSDGEEARGILKGSGVFRFSGKVGYWYSLGNSPQALRLASAWADEVAALYDRSRASNGKRTTRKATPAPRFEPEPPETDEDEADAYASAAEAREAALQPKGKAAAAAFSRRSLSRK